MDQNYSCLMYRILANGEKKTLNILTEKHHFVEINFWFQGLIFHKLMDQYAAQHRSSWGGQEYQSIFKQLISIIDRRHQKYPLKNRIKFLSSGQKSN